MSTVIIGGGIIGLSTAYYLSVLRPQDCEDHLIHIIDNASHLFLSASGYAGGFLAKDWFSSDVASLGELSFRLHKELAEAHDGQHNWGYAPNTAYSLAIDDRGVGSTDGDPDWIEKDESRSTTAPAGDGATRNEMLNQDGTPAWITRQKGGTLQVISSPDGCAQVEPRELGVWLLKECQRHGVKIHTNCTPTKLEKNQEGEITSLKIRKDFEIYEKKCKNIVITAGAWTPKVVKQLFPKCTAKIGIEPLAGYSILLHSPRLSKPIVDPSQHGVESVNGICHSVFCGSSPNWKFSPEAISRVAPNGKPEIYIAGLNSSTMPLPEKADTVKDLMDQDKVRELQQTAVTLTGLSKEGDDITVDDLEVVRTGLCFRPISKSGKPIVSRISDQELGLKMAEDGGVYIASGHGPWGISLSLGTGLCVAEMLLGKKTSADVSGLSL